MAELIKVMHVDDDEDIRVIATMALEMIGDLTVESCSSGFDALEKVEAFAPDLLLLDVMMPGMTGEQTWEKIRQLPGLADVPAVFMTAKAQDSVSRELVDSGAMAVITKPFDPMELCVRLRTLWAEGQ